MSDPDVQRALDAALRNPAEWLDRAEQLKRAADVLLDGFRREVAHWHHLESLDQLPGVDMFSTSAKGELSAFSLGPVYLMVAGYAIENLAKGIIVVRDHTEATVRYITSTHICADLFIRAGIQLVDDEPYLVDRLYTHVLWVGRYHVPRRASELHAAREGEPWENLMRVSTGDGRRVDRLYERMHSQLAAALRV